jgi:antirestriction protein
MENGNQHSQQPTTSPCIYVACLASYSSGILHGVWIAADQDPADIYAEIRSMLAKSREPFARSRTRRLRIMFRDLSQAICVV